MTMTMKTCSTLACFILLILPVLTLAGDLDSPADPDGDASRMPGLEDIYQRLDTGGGESNPAGPFTGPSSGPGPTGHSLQQLMDITPQPDNDAGAAPPQVLDGNSFWGLRTNGTWGLQTGTMPHVGQQNITPGAGEKVISTGFHNGLGRVSGDSDLVPQSIRQNINLFNITGSLVPSGGTATAADVTEGKTFFGAGQTDWVLKEGTAGSFECAPGFLDLNGWPGDECEFEVDLSGIYVSIDTGSNSGDCGTGPLSPCATLTHALGRASDTSRSTVHVANGLYTESVTLGNDIDLLGGYSAADWSRNVAQTTTIIRGSNGGLHKKAVIGQGISSATLVDGFIIFAERASQGGGNSYGIWLNNSPGLTISNSSIYASSGADGTRGGKGADGLAGINGASGLGYSSSCAAQAGGAGGSRTCTGPTVNVSGGFGGSTQCPPVFDTQTSANDGANGMGTSIGLGGAGGLDSKLDGPCFLPAGITEGTPGQDGGNGSGGASGGGAGDSDGMIIANEWAGVSGSGGGPGTHGSGGGGGGAGGGFVDMIGSDDATGGTGGGGGSGGCGGTGGLGGGAGGGSIAVFINYAAPGGGIVAMTSNTIFPGNGGNGGNGGQGGIAGLGGDGLSGGAGNFCAFPGGASGNGGTGGHGGGAGGGAGGVSYGILTHNMTAGNVYEFSNTILTGAGGLGGLAGESIASPGTNGATGDATTVKSF